MGLGVGGLWFRVTLNPKCYQQGQKFMICSGALSMEKCVEKEKCCRWCETFWNCRYSPQGRALLRHEQGSDHTGHAYLLPYDSMRQQHTPPFFGPGSLSPLVRLDSLYQQRLPQFTRTDVTLGCVCTLSQCLRTTAFML